MGPPDVVRLPQPVLVTLLELAPVATFVVVARRIAATNRLGSAWLAAHPSHRELVTRRGGPESVHFDVTAFVSGGVRSFVVKLRYATSERRTIDRWQLTRRERAVVEWVLRGATNMQIAKELACATKTIEHHVTSIFRKANVENRALLIVAAMESAGDR